MSISKLYCWKQSYNCDDGIIFDEGVKKSEKLKNVTKIYFNRIKRHINECPSSCPLPTQDLKKGRHQKYIK